MTLTRRGFFGRIAALAVGAAVGLVAARDSRAAPPWMGVDLAQAESQTAVLWGPARIDDDAYLLAQRFYNARAVAFMDEIAFAVNPPLIADYLRGA